MPTPSIYPENIGLPIELHIRSNRQTCGSIETLAGCYFGSLPLFLKPIKIEPVMKLSRVSRFRQVVNFLANF